MTLIGKRVGVWFNHHGVVSEPFGIVESIDDDNPSCTEMARVRTGPNDHAVCYVRVSELREV